MPRRALYDHTKTDAVFLRAMKENIAQHRRKCPEYDEILAGFDFTLQQINTMADICKIPPLPTSLLKNTTLLSKPYKKLLIKTTSSGTSGTKTLSGFDLGSALCGLKMAIKTFRRHKLLTLKRTNYLVLGYAPSKLDQSATTKALKAVMLLAPKAKAEYALVVRDGKYEINIEGLIAAIQKYAKSKRPVRIIGFPAFLKMFLDELAERGIKLKLPQKSKVLLGGGWKGMFMEQVSKEELFSLAQNTLGINPENCKDHFSTAEHPINYIACKNHRFHVPVFARVLIRDVNTLAPVPYGTAGLLNLISPILSSAPYGSIITDDIAVMRDGADCGCGNSAPYFDLAGRVGLASVKTCAQAASEFLKNI